MVLKQSSMRVRPLTCFFIYIIIYIIDDVKGIKLKGF